MTRRWMDGWMKMWYLPFSCMQNTEPYCCTTILLLEYIDIFVALQWELAKMLISEHQTKPGKSGRFGTGQWVNSQLPGWCSSCPAPRRFCDVLEWTHHRVQSAAYWDWMSISLIHRMKIQSTEKGMRRDQFSYFFSWTGKDYYETLLLSLYK